MKRQILWSLVLVALLITACVQDDNIPLQAAAKHASVQQSSPETTKGEGFIIFAIKDAAVNTSLLSKVLITIDAAAVQQRHGMTPLLAKEKRFDLLHLRMTDRLGMVAQGGIAPGQYTGIQLHIKNVTLVTKDGKTVHAVLPGSDLVLAVPFTIEEGRTLTVIFDMLLQNSLFMTRQGSYVFVPAITMEMLQDAQAHMTQDTVSLAGGSVKGTATFGMDLQGTMHDAIQLKPSAEIQVDAQGNILTTSAELTAPEDKALLHVIIKDSVGFVDNVLFNVTRITAKRVPGPGTEMLDRTVEVRLDAKTATRVAKAEIAPGMYESLEMTLAPTAVITETDKKAHNATVSTRVILIPLNREFQADTTTILIADIALAHALQYNASTDRYYFTPPKTADIDLVKSYSRLETTGRLGILSSNDATELGVRHATGADGMVKIELLKNQP